MNKIDPEKIIYQLSVEDLQTVAKEVIKRKLKATEIKLLEDKLGDYIDWFETIEMAINDHVRYKTLDNI